jgi:ATP-dependent exoDNAse (exonuclease V) beta subunit
MFTNKSTEELRFLDDVGQHQYVVGDKIMKSVSSTIHKHFEDFDPVQGVKMVQASHNAVLTNAEDILASWKHANEQGKLLHDAIEKTLLGEVTANHEDLYRFKQFWQDIQPSISGYSVYPEIRVFDKEAGIAGTIDCLLCHPNGSFVILDWKRCKCIRAKGFNGKKARIPFQNFDDCNYSKYSLQLNFYRTIVERNYLVGDGHYGAPKCQMMALVVFSPGKSSYELIPVPRINLDDVWLSVAD